MGEPQTLNGLWQPLYAEFEGEEAPKMVLDKTELLLADGDYAVRFGGEISDRGTYSVEPGGLTLYGLAGTNAGRTIPCRCRCTGDTLSICYGFSGVRPGNFRTAPGTGLYLANYRRKD